MGQRGTPKAELVLNDDERETLERWARRHTSAQALALRCRIVLACADGGSNTEVAERLGVHRLTVGKWRARFVAHRVDGLRDLGTVVTYVVVPRMTSILIDPLNLSESASMTSSKPLRRFRLRRRSRKCDDNGADHVVPVCEAGSAPVVKTAPTAVAVE